MTHPNPHFAAHPPQPNDPPRPRPIQKPPTPAGVFDLGEDDDGLTPEQETKRFLELLPFAGLSQPFRPRLSAAQLLEAENKIFYNV